MILTEKGLRKLIKPILQTMFQDERPRPVIIDEVTDAIVMIILQERKGKEPKSAIR